MQQLSDRIKNINAFVFEHDSYFLMSNSFVCTQTQNFRAVDVKSFLFNTNYIRLNCRSKA